MKARTEFLLTAVALVVLAGLIISPALAASTGANPLDAIRAKALAAGSYRFTADIEQTLVPRPRPATIGQSEQRLDWRVEGDVRLPDHAVTRLQIESGLGNTPAVTLVRDGQETFLQVGDDIQALTSPAGLQAEDFLAYLEAAADVRQLEPVWAAGERFSRYSFSLDGQRLAEHTRRQLEAYYQGQLPPGLTLSAPDTAGQVSGHGELWVDEHGLPRRQVLDIDMPQPSQFYDSHLRMVVDWRDFGAVEAIVGVAKNPDGSLAQTFLSFEPASPSPASSPSLQLPDMLPFLVCLGLAYLVVLYRRHRRRVYAATAVTLALILILGPALNTLHIVRFQERQAQAAASDPLAEALGMSNQSFGSAQDEPLVPNSQSLLPNPQSLVSSLQSPPAPPITCGSGDPGQDGDGDGLNDRAENCLGTDPGYADSDWDMLTDTLEIEGFDYAGQRWRTDPLQVDSNDDGLADATEWQQPDGEAPNWDQDGDGVPNVWDGDNDDDDVPDGLDLSPFSRTAYTNAFSLNIEEGDFDGYQYIELMVQPQDPGHLRYTTTVLDWPHDEKGQVQDLDDSIEDLRLSPMLKVLANHAPARELAQKYGLAAFENGEQYDLYIPLVPVGDGGRIAAFYAKVAYGPGETGDLRWENARLVWLVEAHLDQEAGGEVETEISPIAAYAEAFRLTGLQVTKEKDFASAILGTPGSPDDDRDLFNVLFGLSATFLNNQSPDLQAIQTRFGNPNTDIVQTWGVPAADVAVDLPAAPYGHSDEALADMPGRLARFLNEHGYPTGSTPSLVLAVQAQRGAYNLDSQAQLQPPASLDIDMAQVGLDTYRGLKRESYEYRDARWQTMSLQDTLEMVQERYDELSGALDELHADYPELSAHDLKGALLMFYASWFVGQTRIVTYDGQSLAPQQRQDQAVYDQFHHPGRANLPSYLVEAAGLAQLGGGLALGNDPAQNWHYLRANQQLATDVGATPESYNFFDFDDTVIARDTAREMASYTVKSVRTGLSVLTALQCIQWATSGRYFGLTGWTKTSQAFGWASRMKLSIRILGVIGLLVSLAVIWVQFGLTADANWSNPLVVKQALAYAIVATAFAVALFVISLNPIGAIFVAVFCLVDLIVFFATGGKLSISGEIIKHVAEFFYSIEERTSLEEADFVDFESSLADSEAGFVAGNRYRVRDEFVGTLGATADGGSDDVADSYAYGKFSGSARDALAENKNAPKCSGVGSVTLSWKRVCRNEVGVDYLLSATGRNLEFEIEPLVRARVVYAECSWGGLDCDTDYEYLDLPEDLEEDDRWEPLEFYLDVLPASLPGLWAWSELANPDPDGDGLDDGQEAGLGTAPDEWDTDGDGLSDKFEADAGESLGADPTILDTDGDGLDDGLEYAAGTAIDQADSDGDGLGDAEELYHPDASGQWSGGWQVTLPETAQPVWVFSDPLNPDADGDGLDDFTERANGTSPYAYNDAPRLALEASPARSGVVYVEPGDAVVFSLSLQSTGPRPVSSSLSLCLPAFFTGVQGGQMQGDRTPPLDPSLADCAAAGEIPLAWSFDGEYTLQLWEAAYTVLTASVGATSQSTVTQAAAHLPYQVGDEADAITSRARVVVDVDQPRLAFSAPLDGAILGGGHSTYVAGGTAGDPTTWIERVELALPLSGTVSAEGASPWAYTWRLPPDGAYSLAATAYDYLGHPSAPAAVNVTVDNTPPTVALDLADGAHVSGQGTSTISVTLAGSAGDNLSGLARVQIKTDERPWREVWACIAPACIAPVTATAWLDIWQLPGVESASGKHSLAVRGLDRAGNVSAVLERAIIVDLLPPTSELTSRSYTKAPPPHVPAGQALALHGVANDAGRAPKPSRPAELIGALDGIGDATLWLGLSSIGENDAGVKAAWVGDFDGDRLADLAVGLPAANEGQGRVALVYGQAGDWPVPTDAQALADSPTSFVGVPGAGIGAHLAAAGDTNGDGFDDLLVSDSASSRAFLVLGSPNPLGRDMPLEGNKPAVWSVLSAPAGEWVGASLGAAGDVNGDGLADLLIGATGAQTQTYLLLGRPVWWQEIDVAAQAAAVLATQAGAHAAGVGDVDGDQFDDLVVAQDYQVHLFAGRSTFSPYQAEELDLPSATATFSSTEAYPHVAALGDVNGDDLADFIIANGDSPRIVFGSAGHNWTWHELSGFSPAPSGFLAGVGDVDADGLGDVLAGNAAGDAYLFSGANLAAVRATLTGVAAAASAPYPAGADLNSDGSSDLLLVPAETAASATRLAEPDYGRLPFVPPDALAVANQRSEIRDQRSEIRTPQLALTHTVDDDGCTGYAGCYTTIQAAVDAASAGDVILVQPGVYASFAISGTDDLAVRGVHPDAVFVDGAGGAYAARVQNAAGVRLEGLTLRDAANAIELVDAGVGGHADPSRRIALDRLLVYDFGQHSLLMSRASSVSLTRCTLAGGDNHIEVYGPPDPALEAAWTTVMTGSQASATIGGGLAGGGQLYVAHGGGSPDIERYDPISNTWTALPALPRGLGPGSALAVDENRHAWALRGDDYLGGFDGPVYAIAYVSEAQIYAGGDFHRAGGAAADYIAEWDGSRWRPLGGPNAPTGTVYAIAVTGTQLYAGGAFGLRGWDGGNWGELGSLGAGEAVYALMADGGDVYVGGHFSGIGGVSARHIARWDGASWHYAGSSNASRNGLDGLPEGDEIYVRALALGDTGGLDGQYLYVGGHFDTGLAGAAANDVSSYNFIRLDKSTNTWVSADGGIDDDLYDGQPEPVWAISSPTGGTKLIVGGSFSGVDPAAPKTANNIALFWTGGGSGTGWDGQAGTPATLSTNGPVRAIRRGKDRTYFVFYIAGDFTTVRDSGSPCPHICNLNVSGNASSMNWKQLSSGADGPVYALAHKPGGDTVFAGGDLYQPAEGRVSRFARWDGYFGSYYDAPTPGAWTGQLFYRYDTTQWITMTTPPAAASTGAALASDGVGRLYLSLGGGSAGLYAYDTAAVTWTQKADLPGGVGAGGALAFADGHLYALCGGGSLDFYRYDPAGDAWVALAAVTHTAAVDAGAALAWDGAAGSQPGDWIYATVGGNGRTLLRYHIPTGAWYKVEDAPQGINAGGGLVRLGQALYSIPGSGLDELWRYGPVGLYPEKLALEQVAFVAPSTAVTATWSNLDTTLKPDDFVVAGSGNAWVGGDSTAWSPALALPGSQAITYTAAAFIDPDRRVYRLGASSLLSAGYHSYRPPAYVSPSGAEFDDIRAALLSGANSVIVQPGRYPQPFYLLSGVSVLGARADQVILEPPPAYTGTLVTAEGVAGARLSGFTLAGEGDQDGLRVEDGARFVSLGRSIVRGARTAIAVRGSQTDLEVANNTLAGNANGLAASGCAPLDVRNTIFAYHSGTALSFEPCAATRLHTYNDFWANATDLSPAAPGAGEILLDPQFVDRYAHDYRTMDGSPVVDAGDPADPAPPGTGARVDIGYIEQGRAAFYADDDYCENCPNDGLTWGVDAFDRVQDALDAAADYIQTLKGADAARPSETLGVLGVSVGVAPGTYTETLSVPSYVRLAGSGPNTIIQAAGLGSAVTFDGVVQAELDGFSLRGAGSGAAGVHVTAASNAITITRNLILGNTAGVRFDGQASGRISFNTIVSSQQAVQSGFSPADAHWRFDDSPGATDFADASGNGHTATCTGGACPTIVEEGRHARALAFDGTDDVAAAASANPDGLEQVSLAAWVKFNSLPASAIMRFVTLHSEKAVLRYDTVVGHGLHFYARIGGSLRHVRSSLPLQTGRWYHVAGTYDGHALRLYLDGVLIGERAVQGALGGGTGVQLSYPSETLDGYLDDVRLYHHALSSHDIAGLYAGERGTWVVAENNIMSGNDSGLRALNGGQLYNDYNLLDNTNNYDGGARPGANELAGLDPRFAGTLDYALRPDSPAVDAAERHAPVPAGGGQRADMGYRELQASPLALFLGKQDQSSALGSAGVAGVEGGFSHVSDPAQPPTATLPAAWDAIPLDTPGETVSYWQTAFTPTAESLYRFYSRATDAAGNREESDWYDGAFVADSTPPGVTWLSPAHNAVLSAALELRAQVGDYPAGEFGVEEISFELDGQAVAAEWAAEPWEPGDAQPRPFRAWIELADGVHNARATALDRAGNQGSSPLVTFTVSGQLPVDTTPPTLTVAAPAAGGWVTRTVTFSGTVADAGRGVASVQVSPDGGVTWLAAAIDNSDWRLDWEAPYGQEYVSFPAWVEARDRAGNATRQPWPITVDNRPPSGLSPVSFSAPPGTHFDRPTPLSITWTAPVDGSGVAYTVLAVDQISNTWPGQAVSGTTATVPLSHSGAWHVHLGARDEAGNQITRHFGAWQVGTPAEPGITCTQRQQSIQLDGFLDVESDEWRADELLDDDERPTIQDPTSNVQHLYATWDGSAFYLGWQGAWWTLDGTLWAYLDTAPGGSALPPAPLPSGALPFEAEFAIQLSGPASGTLWSYSGAWQAAPLSFAHDSSGGTEIRLPWDIEQAGHLNLLAWAAGDGGRAWSVFPTVNPLAGPWDSYYHWDNLCNVAAINVGQPRAPGVLMSLSSPQAPSAAWGPRAVLTYVIGLANLETRPVSGLQLALTATEGLAYQTITGATCADCSAADNWLLDVPTLAAGGAHAVIVSGRLDADLGALSALTTTARLDLGGAIAARASLAHRLDSRAPVVSIASLDRVLRAGTRTIYGTASDGDGSGLAQVTFSTDGGHSWQTALGLRNWSAQVNVPTGAAALEVWARASDRFGQTAQPASATFVLDSNPPTLAFDLPAWLRGDYAEIHGAAADGEGQVVQVELQLDSADGDWLPAQLYGPVGGEQAWRYTWSLSRQDSLTHTVRARAADAAGNVGVPTGWQATRVDNVAPHITVSLAISQVTLASSVPVLAGVVADGGGVLSVTVRVYDPAGSAFWQPAELAGDNWQYTPRLALTGTYALRVEALDLAGNLRTSGPFPLHVSDEEKLERLYLPLVARNAGASPAERLYLPLVMRST